MIVAHGNDGEIGQKGRLPWGDTLRADMARFREKTEKKALIMGRGTMLSIQGFPLPRRENIVITREVNPGAFEQRDGYVAVGSPEDAIEYTGGDAMVIGGERVYRELIPYARAVHVTHVHGSFPMADTFFTPLDGNPDWVIEDDVVEVPADSDNRYALSFMTYVRRHSGLFAPVEYPEPDPEAE